jgi:hypothetical protein
MNVADIVRAARACEAFAEYARTHLSQIEHDSRDRAALEAVLVKKSKTASTRLIELRRK